MICLIFVLGYYKINKNSRIKSKMEKEDIDEEQKRTLWVGGIDSQVDEELLYELMLNVSSELE